MTFRGKICCLIFWFALGLILTLSGAVLARVLLPNIIQKVLANRLAISPEHGEVWKGWTTPVYSVVKQVWIFNVTNPMDVMINGAKPVLKQVGPFGYRVTFWKENISFSENLENVSYTVMRQFHFDPESSCTNCTENTALTIPNILFFTIIKNLIHKPSYIKNFAARAFYGLRASPFVTRPAGQLLFQGYDEVLLKFAQEPFLKGFLPDLPQGKLCLFHGLNNTNNGLYVADTGMSDISKVGQIKTWRGKTLLPEHWWWSKNARMINGTSTVKSAGGRFKPNVQMTDHIQIFVSHIFRSFTFDYQQEFQFDDKLLAYRFVVSNDSFTWSLPWNSGFCNPHSLKLFPNQSKSCFPDGIMDISSCREGNPATAISWPYFLFAESQVHDMHPDLHPNAQQHRSIIELEPITGALLKMQMRIQLNLALMNDKHFLMLKHLPTMLVPIFWLNNTAEMDGPTKGMLAEKLSLIKYAYMACYVLSGLGSAICLIVCAIGGMICCNSARDEIATKVAKKDFVFVNDSQKDYGVKV